MELISYIFNLLPPRDALTFPTLLSTLSTNTYLRSIALDPLFWKKYYKARYTHSVAANEAARRAKFGDDHRLLAFARYALDKRALRLVNEIRVSIPGRSAHARVLAQELSFDVWDALGEERMLPVPVWFRSLDCVDERPPAPHALPRRYWARAAQGVIARYWAVKIWRRATAGEDVSFEEMLCGFSAFFGWSPMEVSRENSSR